MAGCFFSRYKFSVAVLMLLVLCLTCGFAASEGSGAFVLSPEVDIPVLSTGGALLITEILLPEAEGVQQPLEEILFPDKDLIFPYDSGLDEACDYIFIGSLLLPVLTVLGQDFDGILTVGTMFVETMLLTYSTKDILKDLVPRSRPYSYLSAPVDDDVMNSFPSGHTAAAFAIGSFSAFVFSELYPDSALVLPFNIGAYTISASTAALRILSGNHFVTDVIAGAVIGTLYGIGIPMLHKTQSSIADGLAKREYREDIPEITLAFRL